MTAAESSPLQPHAARALRALAFLRCMTPKDFHALAYGDDVHQSTAYRWTEQLLEAGFVQRTTKTAGGRTGYFLGRRGIRATPVTSCLTSAFRTQPSPPTAFYLLQRAALWTSLTKDGWNVGNGPRARLALRRHLVDQQRQTVERSTGKAKESAEAVLSELRAAPHLSPAAELRCVCGHAVGVAGAPRSRRCPDCGLELKAAVMSLPAACRCGQTFDLDHAPSLSRHADHGGHRLLAPLPFDVASKGSAVRLLLVDNPRLSIHAQVSALPLRVLGQPRLDVIIRPSDDDSIYDADNQGWLQRGGRLRLMHRLFETDHLPGHFPYATTATVVDHRPEAQLRVVHTRGKA